MKLPNLFVAGLLINVLCFGGCEQPGPGEQSPTVNDAVNSIDAPEYSVYSALVEEMYIKDRTDLIVIKKRTDLNPLIRDLQSDLKRLQVNNHNIRLETINDFQIKNKERLPLNNNFKINAPYILLDEQEYLEMFQDAQGWDRFRKKYPNSQGLVTLSRIGFNTSMDQALVYVSNQRAGFGGEGYYVLLSKEGHRWTITQKSGVWISSIHPQKRLTQC